MATRPWLLFLIILIITFLFFTGIYTLDKKDLSSGYFEDGWLDWVLLDDPQTAQSVLGSIAEVITGVLAIAITVVAFIVQLAANRYTSKIIDLFVNNKVNMIILSFFVITCINGIWVTNSIEVPNSASQDVVLFNNEFFFPRIGISIYLIFTTLSFFALVPYFYYVFKFVRPEEIILKIENQAKGILEKVIAEPENIRALLLNIEEGKNRRKNVNRAVHLIKKTHPTMSGKDSKELNEFLAQITSSKDGRQQLEELRLKLEEADEVTLKSMTENISGLIEKYQEKINFESKRDSLVQNIEQLGDIALNSLDTLDRSLGLSCIYALKNITFEYLIRKKKYFHSWFKIADTYYFLGCDPGIFAEVEQSKTWLEKKIMNQFESLIRYATNNEQQLVNAVAIRTREIANVAFFVSERQSLDLIIRFFNSFLKLGVSKNDSDVATNIFNQYRLFAQDIFNKNPILGIEIAKYIKNYGQLALSKNLVALFENAAYEIRKLNEAAIEKDFANQMELLNIFLTIDKFPERDEELKTIRGLRKSQAILGSFYISKNRMDLARMTYDAMKAEPIVRLASIREELLSICRKICEESDIGEDIYWIEPNQIIRLEEFFSWFENKI